MRYQITIIKANIKKAKGTFLGIFLLLLIISTSLCAVLAVWKNATFYEHQELKRLGYGDITQWVADVEDTDALSKQIAGLDEVKAVMRQDVIYAHFKIGNVTRDETGLMYAYEPDVYDYHIFDENHTGFLEAPSSLQKNEVYVPVIFAAEYKLKTDDVIEIETAPNQKEQYTVKGFFEDPVMGSTVMGVKTILMNKGAQQALTNRIAQAQDSELRTGSAYHIVQKGDMSYNELQSRLNEKTDLKNHTVFSYSFDTVAGFMLIMQDMFAGFLLLFVMILLGVAVLVLGHSISSSIDQEYVDLGIYKAVGFSNNKLRRILILQYLLTAGAGMLFGMPLSMLVIRIVNNITITSTGLLIPNKLPMLLCLFVLSWIALLIFVLIYYKTARLSRISPITAIRGGHPDIYFNSRIKTPIQKQCLNLSLALRQLISGKKLYIAACIVSCLLVFFLSFATRFGSWVGPEGNGLINAFSAATSDFDVSAEDDSVIKAVKQKVSQITPIAYTYTFRNLKGEINNVNYIMNIISDPAYYHIIKGRTCTYDNEVVLTEFIAEELDVSIGDTVVLGYDGAAADFIVSGINQCANDMGGNFSISIDGYRRLTGRKPHMDTCFVLQDPSKKSKVIKQLEAVFKDTVEISDNTWEGMMNVVSAMSALEVFMYVIMMIFILVVTVMTGSKLLHREQNDLGIYKSLGFSSHKLRISFACRFGIVAAIGSLMGIVLSAAVTDLLATQFLRLVGISEFISHPSLLQVVMPGFVVVLLFWMFAYMEARKIKKVHPILLINE